MQLLEPRQVLLRRRRGNGDGGRIESSGELQNVGRKVADIMMNFVFRFSMNLLGLLISKT